MSGLSPPGSVGLVTLFPAGMRHQSLKEIAETVQQEDRGD